jgi:hypothetical protein
MKGIAMKATGNPPRLGRERSLPFAARIVSGIKGLPQAMRPASAATGHESPDFNPKRNRAERVQKVNGSVGD